MKKNQVGKTGENLAAKYFRKNGYRVIERNFSTRFGEIDLIVNKKGVLVFVEVKTRLGFGQPALRRSRPEWGIDHKKIYKVQKMAQVYLVDENPEYKNLRIDVVCIDLNSNLEIDDLRHYQNMTQHWLV